MKQCKKCPWLKSVDPHDIPNGYCELKHAALKNTIARPGDLSGIRSGSMRVMACHESLPGKERECVGWVANQLGPGNNIGLRFRALDGRYSDLQLIGEQHETFEDTLPKRRR